MSVRLMGLERTVGRAGLAGLAAAGGGVGAWGGAGRGEGGRAGGRGGGGWRGGGGGGGGWRGGGGGGRVGGRGWRVRGQGWQLPGRRLGWLAGRLCRSGRSARWSGSSTRPGCPGRRHIPSARNPGRA